MSNEPLRIGQSADPDDAFMAWALPGLLAEQGLEAELVFDDIESLNRMALEGSLSLAAISVGAYPELAENYRLLRCGASFGDDYGPLVVATDPDIRGGADALDGRSVAIPGRHTTAALLLRIFGGDDVQTREMPFDRILDAVEAGEVEAGLIIHEGQLVFEQLGFHAVFEPAAAWKRTTDLPLPLGAVAVRRDLPEELQRTLAASFARSIHTAFEREEEALDFAALHARGLDRETLTRYVHQYVDAATLDMGESGERAIRTLFDLAVRHGALAEAPPVDLL